MINDSLVIWRPIPHPTPSPNFHLEPLERRYLLSAQIDPSFGDHGHAFVPGPPIYSLVAVQNDGRIILSGDSAPTQAGTNLAILKRLLADGAVDPTFHPPTDLHAFVLQIRVQPDGKILLVTENSLIRLDSDGSLDLTFHFTLPPLQDVSSNYYPYDAAILPDGRILTVGLNSQQDAIQELVTRYNPDGSLDPSFGQDGLVTPSISGGAVLAIRITSDGHLLLLATNDIFTNTPSDSLWQLNPDGSIDPNFGNAGHVVLPASAWASDALRWPQDPLLVQPDGKIIVGVTREWPDGDYIDVADDLVRYTSNGILDPTFANAGVAEIPFDPEALDMFLQGDDKIVIVVGYNFIDTPDYQAPTLPSGLFRLNSDGTPDASFGPDGLFLVDGTDHGDAQALPQGDKIIFLANDSAALGSDPNQFFHVVRIEDAPASSPAPVSSGEDIPVIRASVPRLAFTPLWSEKPIFQDAIDDLDWSALEEPWV